jgi:teichuronic acid biosynthesis glycosyltransferase TuaC
MNKQISVLWLIPAKKDIDLVMPFAKRGAAILTANGIQITIRNFYESRSIVGILKEAWTLRDCFKKNQFDFIHAHFGSTTALTAFLSGCRFLITFRGSDINGDPASSRLNNFLRIGMGILAAHFAKANICVSSELKGKLGPARSAAYIIPSGTEIDLFKPMSKARARETLKLEGKKILLGIASSGRRRVKRYDQALRVKDELVQKGYDVDLLEITGVPHDLMPFYISASDVLILTSEREGSPNIVREALASGVPVVSFDVGDAKDWISLDPFSSVVPFGDVESMVESIEYILKKDPARERRLNVNLFSEESSALKLLRVYNRIVSV